MRGKWLNLLVLTVVFNNAQASEPVEYVFSTSPLTKKAEAERIFAPIAQHLSKITGKNFVYRHPGNWLSYQLDMRAGKYDLIFDDPHFVSWRIRKMDYQALLKLPQSTNWVIIARKQNTEIQQVADLAGQTICVHAPPNFSTLTLQSLFTNPTRQPFLLEIQGWEQAYNGVTAARCTGTILPINDLKKFDTGLTNVRILQQLEPTPNMALSAGPRINSEMKSRITNSLVSAQGRHITQNLRERFSQGMDLVKASQDEYKNVDLVLKNVWGFEF